MSNSLLDAVGNTPLVEIQRLNPKPQVKILAKLEYLNPGGSIKDRAAVAMIEAAERSGELTADKTVVEATSGNTGIGLALVCAVKGYRLLLTMSESASEERRKILRARGAEILLTPGHLGTDGAIEEAYRLAREHPDQYFVTDQFNNAANWQAHYRGTAAEIWEQTGGALDTLVATLGTSGTLMGLSRRLKELKPAIRIVGVEPFLGHKLQGLKNMKESYRPEIFEKHRLDIKHNIDDEEAYEMTRRLAREEGLFVGMSSGAAMAIAAAEAAGMSGGTIVVIFPDSGERYLSTPLFTARDPVGLKLFNTLTRSKEPFQPLHPWHTTVYSCGPTAHARPHLDELRRFAFSDLLCRYLEFRGHEVKHIMSVADLDDKTIAGSHAAGADLKTFTDGIIAAFKHDLAQLAIKPAQAYPRASEHVDDMVAMTEKLLQKGYAYEKLRSLYFNIAKCEAYGRLSGVDIDKIRIGATVDLDEYEKDNPRDFTLFKRAKLSELKRGIYARTAWGNVRPSWHIQCAAISMHYLGQSYDIQASGLEHVFPHHENELAIGVALTGRPPARVWTHCERVLVDGKKILADGTGLNLQDLLDMGYGGREIRYWLISTHYRKALGFSRERLEEAKRALKRLDACLVNLRTLKEGQAYPELDQLCYDLKQGFTGSMDDDLNISAAMASIFKVVKQINRLLGDRRLDRRGADRLVDIFRKIDSVVGVFDFGDALDDDGIRKLIARRDAARAQGDWPLADRLRQRLQASGIRVQDGKP